MNKIFKLSVLSLALLTSSEFAQAAQPGVYLGLGGGLVAVHDEDSEAAFGGRVFLGYNFNSYFGLETNYIATDKNKFVDNDYPQLTGKYSFNAISLVGKAYLPLANEQFNIYGLIGAAQVYNKFNVMYQGSSLGSASDKGIVPTAGIGANYNLNQNVSLGLEISGFGEKDASNRNIGILSSSLGTLSLAYKF